MYLLIYIYIYIHWPFHSLLFIKCGIPKQLGGLYRKFALKWMIHGVPLIRKPPYIVILALKTYMFFTDMFIERVFICLSVGSWNMLLERVSHPSIQSITFHRVVIFIMIYCICKLQISYFSVHGTFCVLQWDNLTVIVDLVICIRVPWGHIPSIGFSELRSPHV